jgi:hypothetical protein
MSILYASDLSNILRAGHPSLIYTHRPLCLLRAVLDNPLQSTKSAHIQAEPRRVRTNQQIAQQHDNRHLANGRHINRRLLLDHGRKVLLAGEVDAHGAHAQQTRIKLVAVAGHAGDDHIAQRRGVLDRPALQLLHLMARLGQALAARKLLHAGDIHAVHARAVVRQQRRERASHHLGPVHDANRVSVQSVPVGQYSVIDLHIFQYLDDGQRRAGQDRFLGGRVVEEADVLVHVEDVAVAEPLDVFADVDDLLQVLVLAVVEDGVVDDYAVDGGVGVGGQNGAFDVFFGDVAARVLEATIQVSMAQKEKKREGYFSLHVFSVQSAYMRAAGSWLARKPTR